MAECSNSADEAPAATCDSYAGSFDKLEDVKLEVEEVERWTNRQIEACLRDCVKAKDFTCHGVNYDRNGTCVLLETNIGLSGSLEETFLWDYYEVGMIKNQSEDSDRFHNTAISLGRNCI